MTTIEIIIIAVGLSMDAFAVSVTLGLSTGKPGLRHYLLPGLYFGFFQALMPLIGFLAGEMFAERIRPFDHWIAFALLGLIGGNMVREGLSKDDGGKADEDSFRPAKMLLLALATSIDALAVGVTFAFFETGIFTAIIIIGTTTCLISILGVRAGGIFGARFRSKAELLGGAVLILLGIKILIEHLFFERARIILITS